MSRSLLARIRGESGDGVSANDGGLLGLDDLGPGPGLDRLPVCPLDRVWSSSMELASGNSLDHCMRLHGSLLIDLHL